MILHQTEEMRRRDKVEFLLNLWGGETGSRVWKQITLKLQRWIFGQVVERLLRVIVFHIETLYGICVTAPKLPSLGSLFFLGCWFRGAQTPFPFSGLTNGSVPAPWFWAPVWSSVNTCSSTPLCQHKNSFLSVQFPFFLSELYWCNISCQFSIFPNSVDKSQNQSSDLLKPPLSHGTRW